MAAQGEEQGGDMRNMGRCYFYFETSQAAEWLCTIKLVNLGAPGIPGLVCVFYEN